MDVRLIDERAMTPEEDAAIRELLCVCFPADRGVFSQTRAWNGSAPAYCVVLEEEGRIVAHLGVVDRTITAGRMAVRVAGIQNVAVHPERRGQNLTARTMAPAMREAEARHFDAGLLFCISALERMYGRLGWSLVPAASITRIHGGQEAALPGNHSTLCYPLRLESIPPGDIHLNGDDW